MKCPNCGEEIQEGMAFCGNCGTRAPSVKTCIKCGKEIPIAMMFCGYCGTPQNGSPAKAGNGLSMGDKNVIAGDVIGSKEETKISGNATIIKNEDETKKVEKCHICGRIVIRLEGYDCPKCGKFTCKDCYNTATGLCADCDNEKEEVYIQAVRRVLEDGRIDMDERKELMALQQQLGINLNRALALENQVKTETSQKSSGQNTGELGNFDKITLNKAQTDLYDNLNYAEAVKKLEPLYRKYKLNEEILTDYLFALSKSEPDKALKTAATLNTDTLCIYLTQIDVAEAKKDYSQMEDCITKAEKFYKNSILLVSRKISFYIKLSEASGDSSYLEIAKQCLESCPEPKTKLEKTWLLKAKMDIAAALKQTDSKILEECKAQDVFKGFFKKAGKIPEEKPQIKQEVQSLVSLIQTKVNSVNNKAQEVPKDSGENIELIKKNAQNGDAKAQYELGEMYEDGKGVKKNWEEAYKWYKRAAEQGYADAQWRIGSHYGVYDNYTEAVKWYKRAAEQGHIWSQLRLGDLYLNGEKNVPKDYTEAVKWYRRAAEQGDAIAQFKLGNRYYYGQGVPQEKSVAVKWYKLAAEQNYHDAQIELGKIYENGWAGVSQNYKEAAKWYRLAGDRNALKRVSR